MPCARLVPNASLHRVHATAGAYGFAALSTAVSFSHRASTAPHGRFVARVNILFAILSVERTFENFHSGSGNGGMDGVGTAVGGADQRAGSVGAPGAGVGALRQR